MVASSLGASGLCRPSSASVQPLLHLIRVQHILVRAYNFDLSYPHGEDEDDVLLLPRQSMPESVVHSGNYCDTAAHEFCIFISMITGCEEMRFFFGAGLDWAGFTVRGVVMYGFFGSRPFRADELEQFVFFSRFMGEVWVCPDMGTHT